MLTTRRLLLRGWSDADREPFALLNRDPEVMRHFPNVLSREESDVLISRIQRHFDERGYGLYALELRATRKFVGYTGLAVPSFQAPFTPAVEIGWRLAREFWNQGLATEAARAVVQHAFHDLGLDELVSFTVPQNTASRRVMEKLGMTHDSHDDFEHPLLAPGDRLRKHVLYRLANPGAVPK